MAICASSTSTRLCGTSRVTIVTVGSGSRGARTSGLVVLPLGTMWIGPRNRSRRRSSCRVDGDTAAIGRSPYTARVPRPSRKRPTAESTGPNRMANWSWCTWCTTCTTGTSRSTNSGEKNGMPFWQSTT